MLEKFRDALGDDCLVRSEELLKECPLYVYLDNGQVDNKRARETDDMTKAKSNHGDRVIAAALAWLLVMESKKLAPMAERQQPPVYVVPGSVAWAEQQEVIRREESTRYGSLRL